MTKRAKGDRATARIVLVDDHPIVREGLARLINREPGLEVCGEADGPQDAMRVVAAQKPDVVVTDLSFPDMSGLEFIKSLKSRFPELPVLVLSVRDESLFAERVLRAGARGYVMKDEAGENIKEAILRVLGGEVYLSAAMAREAMEAMAGHRSREGKLPADVLSDRELQVFEMIGRGLGANDIARDLRLSPKTIETHRAKIKAKMGLADAGELRRRAIQWIQNQGLV